jgi:hypothetical protein
LGTLNRALTPDNIAPRPAALARANGVTVAVFSPSGATQMHGTSVAIGALIAAAADWHRPGAAVPDGTFALLRSDAAHVELVADAAASRTIWYALLDDRLIASTSQRAIVALLGDFEMNRNVLPWFLSAGTLGGAGAWDARLRQLAPGERVMLDRAGWTISRTVPAIELDPEETLDDAAHVERIAATVERVCREWTFDAGKWSLPLSGGTDSRGLLLMLRDRAGLQTLTWGTRAARSEAGNDAQIAARLAAELGVANRYFPTDFSDEPRERLVHRFLAAGEGRVAKISGYLDGFKLWKTLFEEGVDGIIRGDEAFGSMFVRDDYSARFTANLTLLRDYFSPAEIASFELPAQPIPERCRRRSRETLAAWRDRIYQEFRIPNLLASLTDLKTAYVEVANPLLTRPVLECARQLPDHLRTGKLAWRKFVGSRTPAVPFAQAAAVLALGDFVSDTAMLQLMLSEMESANAAAIFSAGLRHKVASSIREFLRTETPPRRKRAGARMLLMRSLPDRLRKMARRFSTAKPSLHPMVFAFRAFAASRMNALMKADSRVLYRDLGRAANL